MAKKPTEVTATEFAILDVLWDRGPTTVREIVEALYGQHRQSLHASVKSLLARLSDKGYATCQREGFAHRFAATVTRDEFVGQQLQSLADSHYGGALAPMLLTLVDRVKLSQRDREAIRKLIDHMT